jgi:hypothetical protein
MIEIISAVPVKKRVDRGTDPINPYGIHFEHFVQPAQHELY